MSCTVIKRGPSCLTGCLRMQDRDNSRFAKEARALSVLASGRTFALSDIDSNNITAHTYSIFVEYQLIVEQNLVRIVACVCQRTKEMEQCAPMVAIV